MILRKFIVKTRVNKKLWCQIADSEKFFWSSNQKAEIAKDGNIEFHLSKLVKTLPKDLKDIQKILKQQLLCSISSWSYWKGMCYFESHDHVAATANSRNTFITWNFFLLFFHESLALYHGNQTVTSHQIAHFQVISFDQKNTRDGTGGSRGAARHFICGVLTK